MILRQQFRRGTDQKRYNMLLSHIDVCLPKGFDTKVKNYGGFYKYQSVSTTGWWWIYVLVSLFTTWTNVSETIDLLIQLLMKGKYMILLQ